MNVSEETRDTFDVCNRVVFIGSERAVTGSERQWVFQIRNKIDITSMIKKKGIGTH